MKNEFLFLIVSVLFAFELSAQTDNDVLNSELKMEGFKTFSGEDFTMEFPIDWDIDDSGLMGTKAICFSPQSDESDQFRENVNILVQPLNGTGVGLKEYVEVSENQIKTLITDSEILLSEMIEEDNRKFQKVIYVGKMGILDLKFEQYYFIIDETAYVLTYTAEAAVFDEYLEISEYVLNSFKFSGK